MEPKGDSFLKNHPARILPWGHIGNPLPWGSQRAQTALPNTWILFDPSILSQIHYAYRLHTIYPTSTGYSTQPCRMAESAKWHSYQVKFDRSIKVGLRISRTNADSHWNPVYNAFHRFFCCGNETIRQQHCKRDLDAANLRPALEQGCRKQTPRARKLFFHANFLHVPNI